MRTPILLFPFVTSYLLAAAIFPEFHLNPAATEWGTAALLQWAAVALLQSAAIAALGVVLAVAILIAGWVK